MSGQKQYFAEQKIQFNNEVTKQILEKTKLEEKMNEWKDKYFERYREIERVQDLNQHLSKELIYREFGSKDTKETQTEIDYTEFNNIKMNSDQLLNLKDLVINIYIHKYIYFNLFIKNN